jgi:hypothetical protein
MATVFPPRGQPTVRVRAPLGARVEKDDDPLSTAAAVFKIDTKALRASIAEEAKQKVQKKTQKTSGKPKSAITSKRVRK